MKFKLEIDMGNAAFENQPLGEVARILREQADKLARFGDQDQWNNPLHDYNGNKVGTCFTVPTLRGER